METLNAVLSSNEIPTHWCDTFFLLLHKGGMADDPNNWRPIAILSITYKIFARAIYYRVRDQLEYHQSEDQHEFRRLKSTIQALFVVESMISNSFEFQFPLWLVSIDLKKAFDRVDHIVLFTALESQGLDIQYINLLRSLYLKQEVCVDTFRFGIKRGVRQGDVLSPLLFNAVLEFAMRKWKAKLVGGSGFALHPNKECERLTNIRYADDIIMFAKTLDEAQHMIELLVEVFAECGLELNAKKTKILSTTTTETQQVALIIEYGAVDIVPKSSTHKYLGRAFSGDLRDRGSVALNNRSACAWMQYNNLKHVLEDKHITLQLRLKLFQ